MNTSEDVKAGESADQYAARIFGIPKSMMDQSPKHVTATTVAFEEQNFRNRVSIALSTKEQPNDPPK